MKRQDELIKNNPELWDLYVRKEEYISHQRDQYDCFRHAFSTNKKVDEPLVSQYLLDSGYEIEYPDHRSFAVCLTHDVDEIYPPITHTFLSTFSCIKNMNFNKIKDQLGWKIYGKEKSPYWNFEKIMEMEKKFDAKSSFYFLATDSDIKRFRYNIEDLELELGSIIDEGWEIGLHGGYYTFNNFKRIISEKNRLEKTIGRKVIGYRNHYLRFKIPETWKLLSDAKFRYDSTLGYHDAVGFRNGMCHPFYPIDVYDDENVIKILEIPLIIMDGTLFNTAKNFHEAWEITKKMINIVESNKGVLTINWHNNAFNCPYKDTWSKLYQMILDYCYNKKAWLTNGEEILRHFEGILK